MATRDGYQGWVWVSRDHAPENMGFGYAYQDPTAGLTVRVIVPNAWKRPLEELIKEARATNFSGEQTVLLRLGMTAFESLGQKSFPEEMRDYAPEAMAMSLRSMERDLERGVARGPMIAFIPDLLYAEYGLPDEPEWMSFYRQGVQGVTPTAPSEKSAYQQEVERLEAQGYVMVKQYSPPQGDAPPTRPADRKSPLGVVLLGVGILGILYHIVFRGALYWMQDLFLFELLIHEPSQYLSIVLYGLPFLACCVMAMVGGWKLAARRR